MGLEHLELGIRVEEEFKVVIADEDYEHLKTIGDLEQYIKDHSTSVWPCPHIPAFSKLQKSLVAITGCSEEEVRLETPLSKFSDPTKRKQVWERLQSESGLKLPKMYSTSLLHDFMKALMWLVFPLAIYAWFYSFVISSFIEMIAILLPYVFLVIFGVLEVPLQKLLDRCGQKFEWAAPRFPVVDVRELTRAVASMNRQQLVTPGSTHFGDVYPRLKEILQEDFSWLSEDELTREARFIEDLGFG